MQPRNKEKLQLHSTTPRSKILNLIVKVEKYQQNLYFRILSHAVIELCILTSTDRITQTQLSSK